MAQAAAQHEPAADALFRLAFEASPVGMIVGSRDGRILRANPAFCSMIGYDAEELAGRAWSELTHPDDAERESAWCGGVLAGDPDPPARLAKRCVRRDGQTVWVEMTLTPVESGPGCQGLVLAQCADVTTRRLAEDRLAYLSNYDGLTGLLNRQAFWRRIRREADRATPYAVVMLDIDRFRRVAESLGHECADSAICEVAARLRSRVPRDAAVARVGADAFALVVPDADEVTAEAVAAAACDAFSLPFAIAGVDVFLTASVGMAFVARGSSDPDLVMQSADAALGDAKRAGGSCLRRSRPGASVSRSHLRLVTQLRRALDRGEFRLHYQPQIGLRDGRLLGVEALVRWAQPGRGLVLPEEFVPALEETGLINPVGDWILREACGQLASWQHRGLAVPRVAVNLSGRQVDYATLPPAVRNVLTETGLDPAGLQLELTENWLMEDPEECIATLAALRQMGVSVAVDDFGTGYSSLAYLRRFRVDALKLDRSFVRDVPSDVEARAIVEAVVTLGHSLGLCVVAEGVESVEQRDYLAAIGCTGIQGFLETCALAPDELAAWVGARGASAVADAPRLAAVTPPGTRPPRPVA